MFDELIRRVKLKHIEMSAVLAFCDDPYRLEHILKNFAEDMGHFHDEAQQLVKEIEEE